MVPPLPILGPRISTSHTEAIEPWLPVLAGKGDEPEDKREGDRSQRYSSSLVAGGLAGRLGKVSLELGKCRDLLQGLLSGLTLALALEMQAGTTGQAWAIPSSSSLVPPGFQSFGQGSPGQLWASLGLPGHLGRVSPANGTRPVGLQPLVNTLGVELVVAGQDSEQLARLKVAEADDTQRLLGLMAVWVKSVGWELLDVCFGEASGLGISQPLCQAQEGLIVLHLHVIHVQIQADGGSHCCW